MTRRAFEHARGSCDVDALLRRAGLTLQDIEDPNARIGAESQIAFLNLASEAMDDPLLGFHLAKSFEPRELGLLYYVQASSADLGEALARLARYSSVAHEGLAAKCVRGNALTFRIDYVGVPRHTDRHQMEFLIIALVRICRHLTNTHLCREGEWTIAAPLALVAFPASHWCCPDQVPGHDGRIRPLPSKTP